MKKLLVFLLIFLFSGILIAQDMKLDELIEKYLKATGMDKFENVQTYKISGKISRGADFQITSFAKRPDRERTEMVINGTRLIYVFIGKTGWMINPFNGRSEAEDMNADMIKFNRKSLGVEKTPFGWNNPFVNWREKENRIELVGREDMEGLPVYNLRVTFNDGDIVNYYLDMENFLILKLNLKTTVQGEVEELFSDYKDVDGVMIPSRLEVFHNGSPDIVMILDKIELNLPIDDAFFIKPSANKN